MLDKMEEAGGEVILVWEEARGSGVRVRLWNQVYKSRPQL